MLSVVSHRLHELAHTYQRSHPDQVHVIQKLLHVDLFQRFSLFLLHMLRQLLTQFHISSTKKLTAFEDLRRNWSRIQQLPANLRMFVSIFTDGDQRKFLGDQVLFNALSRTPIYSECMRTIYSVIDAAVRQTSGVASSPSSFSPVDHNVPEVKVRHFAIRLGGCILHKLVRHFENTGNQEGVNLIDAISIHLEKLNAWDISLFLRHFTMGFLRFPSRAVISHIVKASSFDAFFLPPQRLL